MLASIALKRFDDASAVRFDYTDPFGQAKSGIAVRRNGDYFAFRNLCPHWSTPLDDGGDDVFDPSTNELVCNTHGARFELTSGECVAGPCIGDSLQAFATEVDGDRLIIRRGTLGL